MASTLTPAGWVVEVIRTDDGMVLTLQGLQAGSDVLVQTIQAKLRETISVQDAETLPLLIAAIGATASEVSVPRGIFDIASNLTIPSNVSLNFKQGGVLRIKSGVTVTMNGLIAAGDFKIFEFEDATAALTTSGEFYKGEVRVDWFGADPRVTFGYAYVSVDGTPTGADSSDAFRRCMKFAQVARSCVVRYTPNGKYYVTGDNPCGFQMNTGSSTKLLIQGNTARIHWRPTLTTDSLFGKLGLLVNSDVSGFDVATLGAPGSRMGVVFNTKLGFANIHYFSRNRFYGIRVNADSVLIGNHTIFNFEDDGTASHDDLSTFDTISAACYDNFVIINNNESVKNVWSNCSTLAYTDNAKTFNLIAPAFSGNVAIADHHFTVFNTGEILLFTAVEAGVHAINIDRPRIEVDGAVLFKFCDLGSMNVYANDLIFSNSGGVYDFANDYFVIRNYACLTLERCNVFGNVKLTPITANNQLRCALIARQCVFSIKLHSGASVSQSSFPKITYDAYASRAAAIAAGAMFKEVRIEAPNSTNDYYLLPITYASQGSIKTQTATLGYFVGGKLTLKAPIYLPFDVVVSSLRLDVRAYTITDVDQLKVTAYTPTGGLIKQYTKTFSTGVAVSDELVTAGKMLSIPNTSSVYLQWYLAGVEVTDSTKFPNATLTIAYRPITTTYEANGAVAAEINV